MEMTKSTKGDWFLVLVILWLSGCSIIQPKVHVNFPSSAPESQPKENIPVNLPPSAPESQPKENIPVNLPAPALESQPKENIPVNLPPSAPESQPKENIPVNLPSFAPESLPEKNIPEIQSQQASLHETIQSSAADVDYLTHTIKWRGENLSIIARWYTGSSKNWMNLIEANPGIKPRRIEIGDSILIPEALLETRQPMPIDFLSSATGKKNRILAFIKKTTG